MFLVNQRAAGIVSDVKSSALPPSVRVGSYYSGALGRQQSYTYCLPSIAPDAGTFPLLALLHGRTGNCRDWFMHTRLARYVAGLPLVVACPDGDDGWYTDAADGGERREDDLIHDFLPHLLDALPVAASGCQRAIGGLSMGGYGALKIALKHTGMFGLAISSSGSVEEPSTPDRHPVFGDPIADAALRRRENIFALAEEALCRFPTERPQFFIDCGLSDELLDANRRLHAHLDYIGYGHSYRELPGHHTWPYWDRALRTILPAVMSRLRAS